MLLLFLGDDLSAHCHNQAIHADSRQNLCRCAGDHQYNPNSKGHSFLSSNILKKNEMDPTTIYEAPLDRGLVPDFVTRRGIRLLCNVRLREIEHGGADKNHEVKMGYVQDLRKRPIAELTEKANEQHYEVSTEFIKLCLGPRMKYSCCLFPTGKETLAEAEVLMLESYCDKAQLKDGQDVLDLGCGWGSLSLFLAEKYPNSNITALSNSSTQKIYIDNVAKEKGFKNLTVVTGDVKEYDFAGTKTFDRVLSIEMFEHMKNYAFLLKKVSTWLKDDGYLFIHIFCHKMQPYDFAEGDGWMTKYFFSGGTMPSSDLFLYFQDDLKIVKHWIVNGRHYAQTSEEWLKLQDSNKKKAMPYLKETYGSDAQAAIWFNRWRVFYLAVAEFFALNKGNEWFVAHYLFKK